MIVPPSVARGHLHPPCSLTVNSAVTNPHGPHVGAVDQKSVEQVPIVNDLFDSRGSAGPGEVGFSTSPGDDFEVVFADGVRSIL